MKAPAFTLMERKVLHALTESAYGNGNDFGFIEDAFGSVAPSQLGGVVSSLVKKGVIEVHEKINNTWTQFTWPKDDAGEHIIPSLEG